LTASRTSWSSTPSGALAAAAVRRCELVPRALANAA
jgi:hypothetical protein